IALAAQTLISAAFAVTGRARVNVSAMAVAEMIRFIFTHLRLTRTHDDGLAGTSIAVCLPRITRPPASYPKHESRRVAGRVDADVKPPPRSGTADFYRPIVSADVRLTRCLCWEDVSAAPPAAPLCPELTV